METRFWSASRVIGKSLAETAETPCKYLARETIRGFTVSLWGRSKRGFAMRYPPSGRCVHAVAAKLARCRRLAACNQAAVRCADTSPREAWGSAHELLVRIDQKLLAGRALVVDGDVLEIEHLRQRDHLRVMAREGRLQALDHALAQPNLLRPADLLQEWRQQPAADAPRHAVIAHEFDRP